MRHFLFVLLFTVISRLAFGQQVTEAAQPATVQVMLLVDTARYNVSPAQLEHSHTNVWRMAHRAPADKKKQMQTELENYTRARGTAIESMGALPANGMYYRAMVYYRPNGYAEWVFISVPDGMAAKTLDELMSRLTKFYQTTPFPYPINIPFTESFGTTFGRPVSTAKRVERTGDSTISTLEAARRTTRPDTVKYVYFNQLTLKRVPDEIYRFPNLEELDLSKNSLTQLPARLTADLPRLARLSLLFNQIGDDSVFITPNRHLVALTLQGNRLTRIPDAVRGLRNLESLWMGNNKLKELNVGPIKRLKQLADLNFYNASLTSLPKQIRKLKRVRILDLYYNELTVLPKQMGRMRRLQQLAVAHNKLMSLPPQLTRLRWLDTLYVHHNPLATLPARFNRFKRLRLIDLGNCQFSDVPAMLTQLKMLEIIDLNNNNIQVLPTSMTQLVNLRLLNLRSNPITRDDAKAGPYARVIRQLEAQQTTVYY